MAAEKENKKIKAADIFKVYTKWSQHVAIFLFPVDKLPASPVTTIFNVPALSYLNICME